MAWQDEADKHVNTPVILISIAFNSGTRYYSQDDVRTSTQHYKGNVLNLPQIAAAVGDIERTYERNKISIVFNDTDYEFRGLEASETVGFRNLVVTISSAFQDDSFANALTLFTGLIYDWKRLDGLRFEIEVEESSLNLENKYPNKLVDLSDYANAHDSAVGLVIPIPYGSISANGLSGDGAFGHPSLTQSTGLLFIDTTVDSEKHLVGRQMAAITVDRVYLDGVLQTVGGGNDYTISTQVIDGQTHTEIHWEAGVNPTENSFVSCDITFGSRRPVEAIRHFLENFCGYAAGNFNAANYTAARDKEDERFYTFDGALWEQQALRTILDVWRDEYEFDIYWNKDGEVCFNYLSAFTSGTLNHYQDLNEILQRFESDPQVSKILNYLDYGYNYHYAKTYYYNFSYYQDTDSQTKHGATFRDFKGYRWIRSSTVARDIASKKIIRRRDPINFDKLKFPLKTFSDDLTDVVNITHFEGQGASGYDEQKFQVRSFSYDLDGFINEALLEDVSNFIGRACVLGDDTVIPMTWMNASGAERDYCYLCDVTTEEFTDGEPGKRLFD